MINCFSKLKTSKLNKLLKKLSMPTLEAKADTDSEICMKVGYSGYVQLLFINLW